MLFTNKKPDEHASAPVAVNNDVAGSAMMPAAAKPPRPMPGSAPACVIDAALVITGNLQSERDVQLDGEVHGDIRCTQLIVNRNATLLGNVMATEVVVRGKIKGTIRADLVMLQDTARVESDIFHKSLVIEQGATFDGEAHRTDKTETANFAKLQAMSADMNAAERDGEAKTAAA